jgi:hypothetical protein
MGRARDGVEYGEALRRYPEPVLAEEVVRVEADDWTLSSL